MIYNASYVSAQANLTNKSHESAKKWTTQNNRTEIPNHATIAAKTFKSTIAKQVLQQI